MMYVLQLALAVATFGLAMGRWRAPRTRVPARGVMPDRPNSRWSRWWRTAGVLTIVTALSSPLLALAAVLGMQSASVVRRRRNGQHLDDRIRDGLAEVTDLFSLALSAGATLSVAVETATRWAPAPYTTGFAWCVGQSANGRPLADVLEDLPGQLGPGVRPLTAALAAHDRYGAPIAASLLQLASDARSDRRRRAETAARRLPVALLFPLVVCVLPAFLLLTVVPVVAETLSGLDLFDSPP